MVDNLSKDERADVMRRVKSSGNRSTEVRMASMFRELGISGWRRGIPLIGKPDFVFRKQLVAVFVDGDFWHGHPVLGRLPKSNVAFWKRKISDNRRRDRLVNRMLKDEGWTVIRIWESEIGKSSMLRKLNVLASLRQS